MAASKKPKRLAGKAKAPAKIPKPVATESTPLLSEPAAQKVTSDPSGPPVAGIGASAGGLDAFKKFLTATPSSDSSLGLNSVAGESASVQERFRALIEATSDVVYCMSADWTEMRVLHGRQFILDTLEPNQAWLNKYIPLDDRRHVMETIGRAIRTKSTFELEHRVVRVDGSIGWIHSRAIPIFDDRGEILEWFGAASDITERKQYERIVHNRDQRLLAILNTAADAIITIDKGGVMLSVNPAAQKMFGYSSAEMVGRNVKILMPSPYRELHDGYLARYMRTGEKHIIGIGREVIACRKDGTTFPADLAVSEVDHLQLFTGIIRDITRRKNLEREVLEISALEQRRIGQELHDDVGQQLSGLAMLSDALAQHLAADKSPRHQVAATISAELAHVRDQARYLSCGLIPADVACDGLPTALERLAARMSEQTGVACNVNCSGVNRFRDSNTANHLFRIAQEAISNALRHGKARRINLELYVRNNELVLSIRDDGTGIVTSADHSGGLGIRLMRNRADLIGGRLVIGSAEGKGTIVTCTLPQDVCLDLKTD
jgi:two-component system sensor kinase FixL